MYFHQIPSIIQRRLSSAIWSIPNSNAVYLTFDDGPSTHSSELLEILKRHEVSASFFLLGEQLEKQPEFISELKQAGHFIGNHGYKHLDGWLNSYSAYISNVSKGAEITGSAFYRPPYGRMTPKQWTDVSKDHQIIMWDVMPGDFDSKVSAEQCHSRVVELATRGSIIVLHDNEKSWPTLKNCLEPIILSLKKKGLRLEALSSSLLNQQINTSEL